MFITEEVTATSVRPYMEESNTIKELERLRQSLNGGHLMGTLTGVTALCRAAGLVHMADILSEQTALYRSMLQYLDASMTDPERPIHTRAITRLVLRAIDLLDYTYRTPEESGGYFAAVRMGEMDKADPLSLLRQAAVAAKEGRLNPQLNSKVFDAVWTIPLLSEANNSQRLKNLITQLMDTIPSPDNTDQADRRALALLVTTALTLGSLEYFDSDKLLLLIHAAYSDDVALAARAIAGVFLIVATHPKRVSMEKEAADALTIFADNTDMRNALQETMILVAKARDTDRVTAKIQKNIMPRLNEIQSDIRKRFGDIQSMADFTADDLNPQWEEMLSDSKITEPLEEITEMQSNGEDVMMAAFARLKNFDIFRDAAGWFTPFYLTHSCLTSRLDDSEKSLFNVFCETHSMLCDSDKYSIALALSTIPQSARSMMTTQLESQFEALRQQAKASLGDNLKPTLHSEIMLYLRSMIRFFRLYRNNAGLTDPFIFPNPDALGPFTGMLATKENHDRLGYFYFKNGYWEEALTQFTATLSDTASQHSPKTLSMTGYAFQRLNRMKEALEYYDRASMASTTPDTWLLRKLAWVHRKLGHNTQAAVYYRQLLNMNADNAELNTLLANALYDAGDYQGALKLYYKVEFLAKDGRRTLRPVAWCELMTGQTDKARDTYKRLLSIEDTDREDLLTADLINAGHVEFVSGRYNDALRLYAKGMSLTKSRENYLQLLRADIPILSRLTSDADTPARMTLMLDRLTL